MLGVGQPADAGVGVAPDFYLDGKFLVARDVFGEVRLLDFMYGRYHEGNQCLVTNSVKGDKETFRKNRSTEWKLTKDLTIATCRNTDFVLGVRIPEKKAEAA